MKDYRVWRESLDKALPKQNKFDRDPPTAKQRAYRSFKNYVAKSRKNASKDTDFIWFIFLKSTGEFIGWMSVDTLNRDPLQMAHFGYFIINIYRRNGYAHEAIKKLVPSVLRDLKFHRLEAIIDTDNRASIALMKKCGLHLEGIKKHYYFQKNQWDDQVVFVTTPERAR